MNNFSSVLIAGAGQLGSRYLQGLARCAQPLRIFVQDTNEDSLARASKRWQQAGGSATPHVATFHAVTESLPAQLDLAIVTTTADVRAQVISRIAGASRVKAWILEKVLAQDAHGIELIRSCIPDGARAWVNTTRRMMTWHKQIKARLPSRRPLHMEARGGAWGLACNAIHYLDFLAWMSGETLRTIDTGRLESYWFESKRPGFWEVEGVLAAAFSGGSAAVLSAGASADPTIITLTCAGESWQISETAGLAKRSDGLEIRGRIPFLSEVSGEMTEKIITNGTCELPTLQESAAIHRVFIDAMLEHWRRSGHPGSTTVPIT